MSERRAENNLLQRVRRWLRQGAHTPKAAASPEQGLAVSDTESAKESPPAIPVSHRLRKRLEPYPGFLQKLAARNNIAGWSHNPWQEETTADARATAIALKYLDRFTDAMKELGYLPLIGTELNAGLSGTRSEPQMRMVDVVSLLRNTMKEHSRSYYPADRKTPFIDAKMAINDEFNSRVHSDVSELEITTPAWSPRANVTRVMNTKALGFEASLAYAQLFAESPEGRESPDAAIPVSQTAEFIAEHMGPYNIRFVDQNSPRNSKATGEHMSVSLLRRGKNITDYHRARLHQPAYAAKNPDLFKKGALTNANLMIHKRWRDLIEEALDKYLGNDELLAFGEWQRFESTKPDKVTKHSIMQHASSNAERKPLEGYSSRIEIRSYNNASSNIALTSLAITAILYGVIKTILEDPQLSKLLERKEVLSQKECDHIMARLEQRYPPCPRLPRNLTQAKRLFNKQSLTIAMMNEWVEDTIKDPSEKKQLFAEINTFREAVVERSDNLVPFYVQKFR